MGLACILQGICLVDDHFNFARLNQIEQFSADLSDIFSALKIEG